jgi:hypothetical protein
MSFSRAAYERDVLSSFARLGGKRAPGLSDEDRAVKEAHPLTGLRADALSDLLAALSDAAPDRARWTHAITEAVHNG